VGRALEQLDAQLVLEPACLTAQRRLGDAEACGRPREVPLARDREEVPQSPQIG
jgi:hypothetical protein